MNFIQHWSYFLIAFCICNIITFKLCSMESLIQEPTAEESSQVEICTLCFDDNVELLQFCHKKHKACLNCTRQYFEYRYKNKINLICPTCRKEIDKNWLIKLNIKKQISLKERILVPLLSLFACYTFILYVLMLRYLLK